MLVTVAVAIPVGKLTTSVMHSLGFGTWWSPAKVVPLSELPEQASLLFRGLKALFNGYLGGGEWPGTLHTALGLASTIVMSVALLTLVVVGAVTVARFVWSGLRRNAVQTRAQLARSLHVIYWVGSAAAACGAFWIAGETGGGTNLHESYYATVIFSVAAVVPLLLRGCSPARWLIPVGASIYFLASLVGLTSNYMDPFPWVAQAEPTVAKIARANHVTVGYGGYWVGSSMTWNSHGQLRVRPLMECPNPQGADLCPFYMAAVPSWYVPAERHTFLLVGGQGEWVHALPAGLGNPLAAYTSGRCVCTYTRTTSPRAWDPKRTDPRVSPGMDQAVLPRPILPGLMTRQGRSARAHPTRRSERRDRGRRGSSRRLPSARHQVDDLDRHADESGQLEVDSAVIPYCAPHTER